MKVKVILAVADKRCRYGINTISKYFEVEVRENGKLYSEELVEWVESKHNRLSNYITVSVNHTIYRYSL